MNTKRPENVRLATPHDEDNIYNLMCEAYKEQPIAPLCETKVRDVIRKATERRGGIIGVIEGKNGLEAYFCAVLMCSWYTDAWHIEELSNFVHPNHRSSTHARNLIEFGKWFAEQMKMPIIIGIMSTQRLEPKIRLYRRQVQPCGATFIHNSGYENGLLSEMG